MPEHLPDLSLTIAFLGGALAQLSPCSALLLPAFLASSVRSGRRLSGHIAAYFIGICLVTIPLALGMRPLVSLLLERLVVLHAVAAIALIALGGYTAWGGATPGGIGANRLAARAARHTGIWRTALLGVLSGLGGLCAAPILAAILYLAASQHDPLSSVALMLAYSLGMVVPLAAVAVLWRRLGAQAFQRFGRGEIRLARLNLTVNTMSAISGLLIAAIGVALLLGGIFLPTPQLVPESAVAWAEEHTELLAGAGWDIGAIIVIALLAFATWWRLDRRASRRAEQRADKDAHE